VTARTELRLRAVEGGTRGVTAGIELPLAGVGDGPAREGRTGTHEEGTA
jgi:hypothetical protein